MATGELAHDCGRSSNKVVVLLSGGLDSAVVMAMAVDAWKIVYPFAVDYKQLHAQELVCAQELADHYRVAVAALVAPLYTVSVGFEGGILGSSLTDTHIKSMDNGQAEDATADVYVPGRNTFLLALAASYAEQVVASEIHVGFTMRGFPDCRPGFVKTYNELLKKGLRRRVKLVAPLIRLNKVGVVRKAVKLCVPIEKTRSCLRGGEAPCGKCNSCFLRERALRLVCG